MTGTRAQLVAREEATREVEESTNARFAAVDERFNTLEGKLDAMYDAITSLGDNRASTSAARRQVHDTEEPVPVGTANAEGLRGHVIHAGRPNYSGLTRLSRLDFPRFNGGDVKDWVFKCEQFFLMDRTPEDVKVELASIHMEGKAARWHQSLTLDEEDIGTSLIWKEYKHLLVERFGEVIDDPITELMKLREVNGIVDYHDRFEMIRMRVRMPEAYLVSAYLTGLRNDTQMHVRMFGPKSVRQCYTLGKLYELAHPKGDSSSSNKGSLVKNGAAEKKEISAVSFRRTDGVKHGDKVSGARKLLSEQEMNDRRAKGLCYQCDEPYTPTHYLTHKREKSQLFLMELGGEEDCKEEEFQECEPEDPMEISISAVAGVSSYKTMRVKGMFGKRALFILIDSGSTHNFLDTEVAKKLNCSVVPSGVSKVAVADGSTLAVAGKVENFQWFFQQTKFSTDVMVIPLGCCDMVLGMQWLETLGRVVCDFRQLTMEFKVGLKKLILTGINPGSVREVRAKQLNKTLCQGSQLAMIYVRGADDIHSDCLVAGLEGGSTTPQVEHLLEVYEDLFQEPTELPPFRSGHDHKIPVLQGAEPINQRPYRYAVYQKNEIDKQVKEMLTSGVIQNSSSSYASPVVLVKKKDGSWRLCVDYRGLNNVTIKDRFPIPLIEDLLDELGGSKVFSKIDLRAGYHQVRMCVEDIHKTAFKTHNGHYEYVVMPFGLTNAPATFQHLMNSVFRDFLRKFVLIFFDDILVYSSSLTMHLEHLRLVFDAMRVNRLVAKKSKCAFAVGTVEYLGHVISDQGVATDPKKVEAVANWPAPRNLKQLRGFLGLAGYYRRFIQNFGTIARPLALLLKQDGFNWEDEANRAFDALKSALCRAPVLALPDFAKRFTVETDACGYGIGAVLMQDGHPLAYISKHLKGRQLNLSIYEKELLAVVFALQKWRHYLINASFTIRTDQKSLKYLLEQRLNTPIQQQWLPKLLEFDYDIQYKQGKENVAADALSRVDCSEVLSLAISVVDSDLMQGIFDGYGADPVLKQIIEKLSAKSGSVKHFTWLHGQLRRKGKLAVGNVPELKNKILQWLHSASTSGHSGRDATLHRVKSLFYWKGLTTDVQNFLRSCAVCQRSKYDRAAQPGLLQPLPIPESVWSDLSMDFIDGLPLSFGKSVIFVVVDRLSKAAHFMAIAHPYTAASVAQCFLDNVFKLHGFPRSIISDRDAVFVSEFWDELFASQGVDLNRSSAYHPESDGQTEIVNKCLETYLRCMCSDKPHMWSKWLPLAEWWYNTTFHSATQLTPYEVVFGQAPPTHLPYLPGEVKVDMVARSLQERENMIQLLKFHLVRAQHRMEHYANRHRSERSFSIGDLVYVKLQPYRQQSVVFRGTQKLAPKYFGPYKVLDKYGMVAYKLQLPDTSRIHPVFHVSQLKKHIGGQVAATELPSVLPDLFVKRPVAVLDRMVVKRQGRAATKVLIQWENQPVEEASWEFLYDLQQRFPDFKP